LEVLVRSWALGRTTFGAWRAGLGQTPQIHRSQRIVGVRIEVESALGAARVALQVSPQLGAVSAEAVVVQAGLGVEVVAGPAQGLVEAGADVHMGGAVWVDASAPDGLASASRGSRISQVKDSWLAC
jgi:hypothetical protein